MQVGCWVVAGVGGFLGGGVWVWGAGGVGASGQAGGLAEGGW